MDEDEPERSRPLHVLVDNRFTNKTVLKNLPERTVLIGRLRKDAKLFHPPPCAQEPRGKGRKLQYWPPAPTPEQIRQDDSIPWQAAPVHAAGMVHNMRVKTVSPLRWRANGPRDARLIVIAPLGYRLRKGSKLLYRQPACLIVTAPSVPLAQAVQEYVWSWGIEVNFRDQKQLVGVGQAQVRHPASVETVPALAVAACAFLLLAGLRLGSACLLPRPK